MASFVVGIDVSKSALDACLVREGEAPLWERFSNDEEGFERLEAWALLFGEPGRFAMEATGPYHAALARFLRGRGREVLVLNPRRCRDLARGLGVLDKDDRTDARVVARCALLSRPEPQAAPPASRESLREISRRIEQCQIALSKERTRLKEPRLSGAVEGSVRRAVAFLDDEVRALEKEWLRALKEDEAMEEGYRLLLGVPQVGPKTARVLVSELPDASSVEDPKRLCGLAGLVPRRRRSGTSLASPDRLDRACNRRLKKALYMPAVQALRRSPELKEFYDRLIERGKHPRQAIAALMRKILLRALCVLARKTPWQPRPLTN
jgi:transposase